MSTDWSLFLDLVQPGDLEVSLTRAAHSLGLDFAWTPIEPGWNRLVAPFEDSRVCLLPAEDYVNDRALNFSDFRFEVTVSARTFAREQEVYRALTERLRPNDGVAWLLVQNMETEIDRREPPGWVRRGVDRMQRGVVVAAMELASALESGTERERGAAAQALDFATEDWSGTIVQRVLFEPIEGPPTLLLQKLLAAVHRRDAAGARAAADGLAKAMPFVR